jgi:sporulation protein YlmC with PRC-barrel domain
MLLVRDVLDKQLIDKAGRKMGRVDGIVIALHEGKPPEVRAIELGSVVLGRRLHERVGRWLQHLAGRCGWNGVYRIPWRRITVTKQEIRVSMTAERTRVLIVERWLRDRIIGRIPGG